MSPAEHLKVKVFSILPNKESNAKVKNIFLPIAFYPKKRPLIDAYSENN